jgi:hypothetical protein
LIAQCKLATVAGLHFAINSNKIVKNMKIFMKVDLLNSRGYANSKQSEQLFQSYLNYKKDWLKLAATLVQDAD